MWQSGEITANGLRIHFTRTGGNKPTVVLSHGITDDGLCWTPIAEALEVDYDLVMVDARGHGASEAANEGLGPSDQAEDLAGVVKGLELHKPILMGHSMGAVTTLVMAGKYPELAGAIVLEDPPDWWMPEKTAQPEDNERFKMMGIWLSELRKLPREEIIAQQRKAAPRWSEGELGPWADAKLRFNLGVLGAFGASPAASVDWGKIVSRIKCPALLITADTSMGAIVSRESAEVLQAKIPQLQIAHIPEAGHNIRREQRERYLDAIKKFLGGI